MSENKRNDENAQRIYQLWEFLPIILLAGGLQDKGIEKTRSV
ncbi:hypothetical protein ACFSUM_08235 [Virgibacillus siamensis]